MSSCDRNTATDRRSASNKMEVNGDSVCAPTCDDINCCGSGKDKKRRKSPISKIVEKFTDLTARDHSHGHKHGKVKHDRKVSTDEVDGSSQSKFSASNLQSKHVYLLQNEREKFVHLSKSEKVLHELQDLSEAKNKVYEMFLRYHCSDDLVPVSSKMLILDSELGVKKAFYALVYNNVRAALVWDNEKQEYDGMITISDFIYILVKHYKSPLVKMEEIENHTIKSWKEDIGQDRKPLVHATEKNNITDCLKLLTMHKIHRLPVFDSDTRNPLHILSHKRIMKFLYLHMHNIPKPDFMEETIEALGIGTYDNVATVTEDTPVYEALSQLMARKISALPVLNKQGKCINLYAKFDAMNLAAQKCYDNLDIPVWKALELRYGDSKSDAAVVNKQGVYSCYVDNTLISVIQKFMSTDVHRLTVHNRHDNALVGIVSLSDVLSYLVIKQGV